jgi:hypothetical protein
MIDGNVAAAATNTDDGDTVTPVVTALRSL